MDDKSVRVNPVRAARERACKTQEATARALSVSGRTVLRWEAEGFTPSRLPLATLEALAALYGEASVESLLGRTGEPISHSRVEGTAK